MGNSNYLARRWGALIVTWIILPLISTGARAEPSDTAILSFSTAGGFCPNGVYSTTDWPQRERPENLAAWGSFCAGGDGETGRVESEPFLAPQPLTLYLAGYLGQPNLSLVLKDVQSGKEFELHPDSPSGALWQRYAFTLPASWVGQAVRIVAVDNSTSFAGWFGFTQPILPRSSILRAAVKEQRGFCPNGVFGTTSWPGGSRSSDVVSWGSFCESGDANVGWMASAPISGTDYLGLYIAGYPGLPGVDLGVENVNTREYLPLQVPVFPKEVWTLYYFQLPARWKAQSIRIIAKDDATGPGGWLGVSSPVPSPGLVQELPSALKLCGLVVFSLLILYIPALAACTIVIRYGIQDPLDLLTTAVLSIGIAGYVAFWIYFASPAAGSAYSFILLVGSVVVIIYSFKELSLVVFARLKPLMIPSALVAFASVFIITLGYLHGGQDSPAQLAANRFAPPIQAGDNIIPELFADAVTAGHIPKPLHADWLSSDRPPLQTGVLLYSFPLVPGNREFRYQILAAILQCTFLAALWMFLRTLKLNDGIIAVILLVVVFSGFTFLNAFYTWPKLFPLTFLLVALAYVRPDNVAERRNDLWAPIAVGLSIALAMLCHGGSMFAIVGTALTLVLFRACPRPRWIAVMATTAFLLYAPWIGYQRTVDPPGDRLVKWHLGGQVAPKPETPLSDVIVEHYGELKVKDLLRAKRENFETLVGDLSVTGTRLRVLARHLADGHIYARNAAAASLRSDSFYHWIPCLGPAALGPMFFPILLLLKRPQHLLKAAISMWICNALIVISWCLLMFGPGTTVIHQGTYLMVVLALAASYLIFWLLHPIIAGILASFQIACHIVLFIWLTPASEPGEGLHWGPVNWALVLMCILCGMGIIALLMLPGIKTGRAASNLEESMILYSSANGLT